MTQQREVDLLVAGAGPAGMTAALVASLQGLDVLVCEKSGQVGGTGVDLGRHAVDSRQSSEPRRGLRRQRRDRRKTYLDALVGNDVGPRAAHGVSANRAGRDRLAGTQQRR